MRYLARRYDHSREQLREMALTAAHEIVAQEGLRGLTTRKVAARIGYTVGTIYNLFDNLDDLIVHLNGQTLDELYNILSGLPLGRGVETDLLTLSEAYAGFASTAFNRWNLLFEHRLPAGRDLPPWYDGKVDRLLALVEGALAPMFDASKRGECRKSAQVLWASLHGICSLANAHKLDLLGELSAADLSRRLIRNFVAGLARK